MYKKIVVFSLLLIMPACTVNNLHYNLEVVKESQPLVLTETSKGGDAGKHVTSSPKVVPIKPECLKLNFPELKSMPEPPIKEIEETDPKDHKRIYEIMLVYTNQMRQVDKDTKTKYRVMKAQYRKRCLQ